MKEQFLFIFLIVSIFGHSQINDMHLWTGAGVEMKFSNKISVDYKTQTRLYKNSTSLRTYLNQAGIAYKLGGGVKAGINYRYSRKKKDSYFVNDNRIVLETHYGYKVKKIGTRISTRVIYQHSFDRLRIINETIAPNTSDVFRIKIMAKYKNSNFKRIQPFMSYEYFKSLNDVSNKFAISSYRLLAGIKFDLPFSHKVKLNYIYHKANKSIPEVSHIYAIQYTYNLGRVFRK